MYIFGGEDGHKKLNDTWFYDFSMTFASFNLIHLFICSSLGKDKWEELKDKVGLPEPRMSHTSVCYRNSMYIFGGLNEEALSDLWELNLGLIYSFTSKYSVSSLLY